MNVFCRFCDYKPDFMIAEYSFDLQHLKIISVKHKLNKLHKYYYFLHFKIADMAFF